MDRAVIVMSLPAYFGWQGGASKDHDVGRG